MIKAVSLSILGIIVPLAIVSVYLLGSDKNFYGLIALVPLALGAIGSLNKSWHWFFSLGIIIVMHGVEVEGMVYTRFAAVLLLAFLVGFKFLKNDALRPQTIVVSVAVLLTYHLAVLGIQPYVVKKIWLLLYFQAILIFAFVQFSPWRGNAIPLFLTVHLIYSSIWSIIEKMATGIDRVSGPTMSATALGVMLAIEWSMLFSYTVWKRNANWTIFVGISIFVFVAMILSGTRMALIGVFAGVFLSLTLKVLVHERIRMVTKIGLVLLELFGLLVIASAFWVLSPDDSFLKQGFSVLLSGNLDMSSMGRIAAWYSAVQGFSNHMIWGLGSGNFRDHMEILLTANGVLQVIPEIPLLPHAHNIVLTTLADHGLIGTIVIGSVLGVAIYRVIVAFKADRSDPIAPTLLIGTAIMFLLGQFDAIPLFPSTLCFGAWLVGVMIQMPKPDNLSK